MSITIPVFISIQISINVQLKVDTWSKRGDKSKVILTMKSLHSKKG